MVKVESVMEYGMGLDAYEGYAAFIVNAWADLTKDEIEAMGDDDIEIDGHVFRLVTVEVFHPHWERTVPKGFPIGVIVAPKS